LGKDGDWLLERLESEGVDTSQVQTTQMATGHAMIQVIPSGENAIVLHGGANQAVNESDITRAVRACSPGDYLLVQNEISSMPEAIRQGKAHQLRVIFNPAPMTLQVQQYPLESVDVFILNETEAQGLTGKTTPEDVRLVMSKRFPGSATVLTMGSRGAVYFDSANLHRQSAFAADPVDTTAAGDTFIGYFLAELVHSNDPAKALSLGCRAAAICVTRVGASDSIPLRRELG
jgi:ribokinase